VAYIISAVLGVVLIAIVLFVLGRVFDHLLRRVDTRNPEVM
jgi:hypothetical protein